MEEGSLFFPAVDATKENQSLTLALQWQGESKSIWTWYANQQTTEHGGLACGFGMVETFRLTANKQDRKLFRCLSKKLVESKRSDKYLQISEECKNKLINQSPDVETN